MLGLLGEPAQQPVAEPEVLHGVGCAEGGAGQRAVGLPSGEQRLGVGGDGEDDRDAELGGHLGRDHRPDVGHPQVHDVDVPRGAQDPPDAAPRLDPVRPRRRRTGRRRAQRDPRVVVALLGQLLRQLVARHLLGR